LQNEEKADDSNGHGPVRARTQGSRICAQARYYTMLTKIVNTAGFPQALKENLMSLMPFRLSSKKHESWLSEAKIMA
jgi:hypothetical protein